MKITRPQNQSLRLVATDRCELMDFLIKELPHKNRDNIKSILRNRWVRVDGKVQSQYNWVLYPGQLVEIVSNRTETTEYPGFKIVYEDQEIVVVDKQAGMLTIATEREKNKTVYSLLRLHVKKQHPLNKIFIVHRLDRETSGLVVFARSEKIKTILQKNWNEMVIERTYIALVEGRVENDEGTITSWLKENKAFIMYSTNCTEGAQKAITHYQVIKKGKRFSLLKINLETGRKNQIRVHLKDLGHPVVGDKKYGSVTNPIARMGLHAQTLSFIHPKNQQLIRFESAIPAKFESAIN